MRRLVIALVLVFGAMPASAQELKKPYATPRAPQPGEANSEEPWQPPKRPTPEQMQREMNEETRTGRSGFWTSPYPSKHGAYRYRLLILGVAITVIMGLVAWRVIRRTQPPRA